MCAQGAKIMKRGAPQDWGPQKRPNTSPQVFSKIMERIMYNRLLSFLNKYKIIYNYQFGFRDKHSTYLALITLTDKISEALDAGKNVIGIFLDFSKAFDTINHEIMLLKLEHYGIRGVALQWFKSYLNDRQQYVTTLLSDAFCR